MKQDSVFIRRIMQVVQVKPESYTEVQRRIVREAEIRNVRVKRDERLEMSWQTGVHVACKCPLPSNAGRITTALESVGDT